MSATEIRSLSEGELDDVNGGHPALVLAGMAFVTACMWAGASWDLPIGATAQDAAAALGMEHLL